MVGTDASSYKHENFYWSWSPQVSSNTFNNKDKISGMNIEASINNYDIVKELGKESIRETVGEAFKEYAKKLTEKNNYEIEYYFKGDLSDEGIEKAFNNYFENEYLPQIKENYQDVSYTTDFSIYTDDDIKVFAKNLKEYNGTTLQYVGIMPTSQSLSSYIKNVDETKINKIINNLKDLKTGNFKDGVITHITGYIPKFDFEYELKLKDDLEKMGIKNVFEQGKANLTNICDDKDVYISKAIHKANIEFTQDGIKAAAATGAFGYGAGDEFDYIYEVPVEEIDITFDKPYMFLIRDKETGEIWFTGTVYEPLLWENEPEKDYDARS